MKRLTTDVPAGFHIIHLPNTELEALHLEPLLSVSAFSIQVRMYADPQFLKCDCFTLKSLSIIIFPHTTLTDCFL